MALITRAGPARTGAARSARERADHHLPPGAGGVIGLARESPAGVGLHLTGPANRKGGAGHRVARAHRYACCA